MNPINKFLLWVMLLPSGLYRRMGIDLRQLGAILRTKLTMDDRRPLSIMEAGSQKRKKPLQMATLGTIIMSAILGAMYLYAFFIGRDLVTQLTVYFTLFFLMLSATLISDFTSVLVDVRDTFIILPKPVSDRTVVVARLLHISIHIFRIVIPMALPGLIYIGFSEGALAVLLLMILVLFMTAFSLFFINGLYILILRITTPEKFRAIISYIQIIFAITVYAGYQVLPRLIGSYQLDSLSIAGSRGILAWPLYWFAAGFEVLHRPGGNLQEIMAALLGFMVPLLSLWVVVKYLAPSFNNKMALMGSSTGQVQSAAAKSGPRGAYSNLLSKLFTRTASERMGFLFTWKMMMRSRDFKLKVYPSIGYLLVYLFLMVYRIDLEISDFAEETNRAKLVMLSPVYITSLLMSMACAQMRFSERYKASWLFFSKPLNRPGDVMLGGMKAAILSFYIPIVLVIITAAVLLAGFSVLPNMILGLSNQLLITTLLFYATPRVFPFSLQQNANTSGGSFLRSIFVVGVSAIIALVHFLCYSMMPLIILSALISLLALWLLMSGIRKTSWETIRKKYSEE